MARTLTLLVPLVLLLGGCSLFEGSHDVAPCLKDTQQQLRIEWGTYEDYAARTGSGYELSVRGELVSISVSTDTTRDHVAWIEHPTYCEVADNVNASFLKVQALHSPGTRGRYIRYSNPGTRVYLQAVWNPDLETFQSRDMRRLFDDLMRLVPTDAD